MGEPSKQFRDPFEAELATFRPRPMSPTFESGIAARLDEPRSSWRIGAARVAVAAAACVVIGLAVFLSSDLRSGTNAIRIGTRPSTRSHGHALRAAVSPPSVLDYQQAFAESSDAFDTLLARPAGSGSAPVRAFSFPSPDAIDLNLNNTGDKK